jgi:hypothetical protein
MANHWLSGRSTIARAQKVFPQHCAALPCFAQAQGVLPWPPVERMRSTHGRIHRGPGDKWRFTLYGVPENNIALHRCNWHGPCCVMPVRIDDNHLLQETQMNTLSSKLTGLAAVLLMNGLIMGAVGYLFEIQSHPHMSVISFARAVATHQWLS